MLLDPLKIQGCHGQGNVKENKAREIEQILYQLVELLNP